MVVTGQAVAGRAGLHSGARKRTWPAATALIVGLDGRAPLGERRVPCHPRPWAWLFSIAAPARHQVPLASPLGAETRPNWPVLRPEPLFLGSLPQVHVPQVMPNLGHLAVMCALHRPTTLCHLLPHTSPSPVRLWDVMVNASRAPAVLDTAFGSPATASGFQVYGLDINEEFASLGKAAWEEAGVAHKIELMIAPALESLDQLIANGLAGQVCARVSLLMGCREPSWKVTKPLWVLLHGEGFWVEYFGAWLLQFGSHPPSHFHFPGHVDPFLPMRALFLVVWPFAGHCSTFLPISLILCCTSQPLSALLCPCLYPTDPFLPVSSISCLV